VESDVAISFFKTYKSVKNKYCLEQERIDTMTTPTPPGNSKLSNEILPGVDTAEMQLPLWQAHMWFVVLWCMMLVDIVDRFALGACMPLIKKEFALTDAQGGMLNSVFAFSVAALAVPVSILAFKWSRRKVLAIMVAVWSIATWGTGLAKGYTSLLAARFSLGVGEAGYAPIAYSFVSIWYPKSMRGLMFGWLQVANQAAATLGLMLCGWIAFTYGWQACFGILAVPGLILATLGWFMPDFKNKVNAKVNQIEQDDAATSKAGMKEAFLFSIKTPSVLFSILMTGFVLVGSTAVALWGVTLYVRTFGMNIKEASAFIGYVGLISVFIPVVMGKIADLLVRKRQDGRLIASVISACAYLVAGAVFTYDCLHTKDLVVAFITYGLLKGFLIAATANANNLTQDLVPPHYRTITNSLIPISNQGIGGMTGPLLCGILSDKLGINLAFLYIVAIGFTLQMIATIVCKVNFKKDLLRLESLGRFNLERE
jgi:MFS family permease